MPLGHGMHAGLQRGYSFALLCARVPAGERCAPYASQDPRPCRGFVAVHLKSDA